MLCLSFSAYKGWGHEAAPHPSYVPDKRYQQVVVPAGADHRGGEAPERVSGEGRGRNWNL